MKHYIDELFEHYERADKSISLLLGYSQQVSIKNIKKVTRGDSPSLQILNFDRKFGIGKKLVEEVKEMCVHLFPKMTKDELKLAFQKEYQALATLVGHYSAALVTLERAKSFDEHLKGKGRGLVKSRLIIAYILNRVKEKDALAFVERHYQAVKSFDENIKALGLLQKEVLEGATSAGVINPRKTLFPGNEDRKYFVPQEYPLMLGAIKKALYAE